MNKIKIFLIVGPVAVFVICGWLGLSYNNSHLVQLGNNEIPSENIADKISLIINSGEGAVRNFDTELREKITAFDLLKMETEKAGINLRTKSYDMGIMIEAIGDKENGESGKYWLYYVNGEMPQVAADKKELKAGDKVEFKFEKSPF